MGNLRKLFGQRVRGIRLAKGMTQEKLAEKAGLHLTYIGIIERGKQSASLDVIEKIAKALGVDEREFFSFHPKKQVMDDKEKVFLQLKDIFKKQPVEDIKKILEICKVVFSKGEFSTEPIIAEEKVDYQKKNRERKK
ncbi:MAG TPA: XRE family transcriptional regulator [Candidatus Omnitrophica bacterium]|nr:XRE family transcriptional regulator [Candidatus Omnitrophota bacterium]